MDADLIVILSWGAVGFLGLGAAWLWAKREHRRLDKIK